MRSFVAIFLLLSVGDAAAALVEAPSEVVLPDDGAALAVALRAERARDVRLQLERAPVGVRLERDGRTGWTLRWDDPETRYPAEVVLGASPIDSPTERERIEILLVPAAAPRTVVGGELPVPSLQLAPIPLQSLQVGKPWALWLRPEIVPPAPTGPGTAPGPFLALGADAPDAMTIESDTDGWYRLALTPLRPGEIRFEVIVQHGDDRAAELRRPIVLQVRAVGEPPPRSEPPPAPPQGPLQGPLQVPDVEPLPSQIVSAGRTVVFKVSPQLPEGQRAIVQIDRLPRNARFDEGEGGSRTFHWMTGARDQGEHRFRLTAINVDDASLRRGLDVTVIVGDPTRSKSMPAQ